MLFVISLVILILLASVAIWLRNRWVLDTFNSYGAYGNMAGLYLYRRFGLLHIGTSQDNTDKIAETEGKPGAIVVGELDLKPGYSKQVKTCS